MGLDGQPVCLPFATRLGRLQTARAVPAFQFTAWRPGVVATPLVPARPFGLDLPSTRIDGEALAELARLRNLAHIDLANTTVTDAGVVLLDGLKALRGLEVGEGTCRPGGPSSNQGNTLRGQAAGGWA